MNVSIKWININIDISLPNCSMLLKIDCLILLKKIKIANKEMHDKVNEEKCLNDLGCKSLSTFYYLC